MSNQQQSPPDSISNSAPLLNEVERAQASAWFTILNMPDATAAAQKMEADARRALANLDPLLSTESEIRCALAVWKNAMGLFGRMKSFVDDVHRRLDAAAKETERQQKALDKQAESGTMAKD